MRNSSSRFLSIALVYAVALGMTQPSHAGWRDRTHGGNAVTPAAAGGDHAVAGSGPNGSAAHVGGWAGNGNGGAVHFSGGAYRGANGSSGWRGSYTNFKGNGAFTHQGAHNVAGPNGYDSGHNSVDRNSDGSGQASWQNNGQSASGGKFNSVGGFSRASNGVVTGSSQTSASGARGSYNGSTTAANGTTTHDGDYTNAAGDGYDGQTSYTKGQGYSHSGSCTNAQGQTIACH